MAALRLFIPLCDLFSLTTAVQAGEGSAETPECKEITARIIERTNTRFDHFSPSGGSVFFKGPDMVLICDPKFVTYISLNWDGQYFNGQYGSCQNGFAGHRAVQRCHRSHGCAASVRSEDGRQLSRADAGA